MDLTSASSLKGLDFVVVVHSLMCLTVPMRIKLFVDDLEYVFGLWRSVHSFDLVLVQ